MKKMILVPAAVLLFGGIALANTDSGSEQTQQAAPVTAVENETAEERIGFSEAEKIARELVDGQMTDIELERDRNREHYDIEMYHNGYEYDIEIDAYTGEVLKNKREKEDDNTSPEDVKAAGTGTDSGERTKISADQAIQAALEVVSGTVEEVELDSDDGRVYYEVEIENGHEEHEVEVDAFDGSILEIDTDFDD